MVLGSSLVMRNSSALMLDEVEITPKASVHNLGVLLNSGLGQVAAMARSTYHQLQLVCQLCPFLDKKDLALVTHVLVISRRLNCCNVDLRQHRNCRWYQNATALSTDRRKQISWCGYSSDDSHTDWRLTPVVLPWLGLLRMAPQI